MRGKQTHGRLSDNGFLYKTVTSIKRTHFFASFIWLFIKWTSLLRWTLSASPKGVRFRESRPLTKLNRHRNNVNTNISIHFLSISVGTLKCFLAVNKLIMHSSRFFLCHLSLDNVFVLAGNVNFWCSRMLAAESFGACCTQTLKWSFLLLFYRDV